MKKQMLRVALALFVLISLVLGSLWPAMAQEPEAAEAEPQAQETVLVGVSSPTVGAGSSRPASWWSDSARQSPRAAKKGCEPSMPLPAPSRAATA